MGESFTPQICPELGGGKKSLMTQSIMCGEKLTLHITLNTPCLPVLSMVVLFFSRDRTGKLVRIDVKMTLALYRTVLSDMSVTCCKTLEMEIHPFGSPDLNLIELLKDAHIRSSSNLIF